MTAPVVEEGRRATDGSRQEPMTPSFVAVRLRAAGASRKETFLGREFRVIPAVMVRSQVLSNNLGITFLPPGDITDEWAGLWNGIPVLVGPHPSLRGVPCSGRDAVLWNERLGGWIFHAAAVQESAGVRHLSGEVWLDESRVNDVVGLQAILDRIIAGQPVELSTGFPAQMVVEQGMFQGSRYEAIMHPAGADHLVISTEMTGSCSVNDGCGLGVNKYEGNPPMETNETRTGGWKAAFTRAGELLLGLPKPVPVTWQENAARQVAHELESCNELPTSDQDRENRVRASLQEKHGSRGEVIVAALFSETTEVVFWLMTPLGSEPQGPEYFRVSFTEGEGGACTFGEPEKVTRKVVYEPVGNSTQTAIHAACNKCASREEATMSDKKEGQGEGVSLEQIKELIAPIATAVQSLTTQVTAIQEAAKMDPSPSIAGLKKSIGELYSKFDTMKGVTETAVQERDRERQHLVESLAGNYRVAFTQADLESKPLDELRKIAATAGVEDYTAKGGPRSSTNSSEGARFMEPVPYFKPKGEKEGGK